MGHITYCTADAGCGEIVARLKAHASRVRTLTWDNGKDMVEHACIAAGLNAQVYFTHPYAARERDTNENPFGLLAVLPQAARPDKCRRGRTAACNASA
ncbi:MAG TPA: hypothetical protein VKB96_03885 [Gammaproteobacteria bacterium]|nr:hypothetical protein [Gammaproteobacteria bacterium]